jgi:hypothetical protein
MSMGEFVKMAVDSAASKSVLLSVVVALGGFGIKTAVHQSEVDNTIAWHTKALAEIHASQSEVAKGLEYHTVVLSQISGKLDVINQKIDDDRNYAQRHQPVNTR